MKLITIEKDKQGHPIAQLDLSTEEIDAIKKAAKNHPKYDDPDSEGMRLRGLLERDYTKPFPNITIKDMKEVINKHIQDTGENPLFTKMNDELHLIRKTLNPS